MNFSFVLITITLIILVIGVYYLNLPKKNTIRGIYNDFALFNNKFPSGFTAGREGNNYINYYVNLETANLDKKIESFPIDLDAVEYTTKTHGDYTLLENGFKIEGISKTFTCPDNWYWDVKLAACQLNPLCLNEPYQQIKGINQYHFDSIATAINRNDENAIYHDRVYAICQADNSFELGYCENNLIYNQLGSQPYTANPCVYYDVCNDLISGTRHRYQIKDGLTLADNQYYVCESGTSVLYTCTNSQVFSETLNACVEMGPCFQKENGFTFYLDDNTYQICLNERIFDVSCRLGVFTDTLTNPNTPIYSCVNMECDVQNFQSFYTNDIVSVPLSGTVCENNKPIVQSCPLTELSYNVPLPSNTIYTTQREFALDSAVTYPQEEFIYTNSTFSEWACSEIVLFDITDSGNALNFVYSEHLPVGVFLVTGDPIINFNNYLGEIRQRVVSIDAEGNQSTTYTVYDTDPTKYVAFISDDVLYEFTDVVNYKLIIEGLQIPILAGSTLALLDIQNISGGVPAYHPLKIVELGSGNVYRFSIVTGDDETDFGLVFDVDASIFDASQFSTESPYLPKFFTEIATDALENTFSSSDSAVVFSKINFYANSIHYASIATTVLLMFNCEVDTDFANKIQLLGRFSQIPTDDDINSFPETTTFTSTTAEILSTLNIPQAQMDLLYNIINPNQ